MRHCRTLSLTLAAAVAALAAGVAEADVVEYTDGHADIGLGYEGPGELFLHYHFEGATVDGMTVNDAEFEPEDVYTRVPDSRGFNVDSDAGLEFTGVMPDGNTSTSDLWILPQGNVSGVPFLGFATEELSAADWVGDLTFALTGVRFTPFGTGIPGQGEFSLWQTGPFGGRTPFMSTVDGIDPTEDFLSLAPGNHDHFNYGFSEEGQYEIDFTASGTHVMDGFVEDFGTFQFAVGNATPAFAPAPVPEPGSMALIGLAACGLAGGAARRRREREPDAAAA